MSHLQFLKAVSLVFLMWSCQPAPERTPPSELYAAYCGSCHLAPAIEHLPRGIWDDPVLPEMAARLGYRRDGYDPLARYSIEEVYHIQRTGAYPQRSTIDSATWEQLHQWILSQAPEEIRVDTTRSQRNRELQLFEPEAIVLDTVSLATITYVDFVESRGEFVVGDAFGRLQGLSTGQSIVPQLSSPAMAYLPADTTLVVEIGYMNPSDEPLGKVQMLENGRPRTIMKELKRPVFAQAVDLDDDGSWELLVCEFGNYAGQFSMIYQEGGRYQKKTLLPVPGTIKFEVHDMDKDGHKDLVVLASQGNEGIYIFYQDQNAEFRYEQVIRLGPEYGSSWFDMFDFDGDGDLDILFANGDNADYSIFAKPYHGVRIFENQGDNSFEEVWFYPIYGATRVLAEDYDLDGDMDLAVMAFFPDFRSVSQEGFVFLENQGSDQLDFKSYTFEGSADARWLVMDQGDVDQDGDIDLLLGSFMLYPGEDYQSITDRWIEKSIDLYLLRNKSN